MAGFSGCRRECPHVHASQSEAMRLHTAAGGVVQDSNAFRSYACPLSQSTHGAGVCEGGGYARSSLLAARSPLFRQSLWGPWADSEGPDWDSHSKRKDMKSGEAVNKKKNFPVQEAGKVFDPMARSRPQPSP